MNDDGLRRVRLAMHRQRAWEMAFASGRLGGWIGKAEEVLRFLSVLSLCRETHDVSERFFTANWPHHEVGCWYAAWPDCRN